MAGRGEDALTGDFAHIVWIVLALALVGSSLSLRRLPKGNLLKIALIWVLIFGIVWLAVSFWMGRG